MTEETKTQSQQAGPQRCPFCHEAIDLEADKWLACEACLARHHADCWKEHGQCSACQGSSALERPGQAVGGPVEATAGAEKQAIQVSKETAAPSPEGSAWPLIALILMTFAVSIMYRILVEQQLEQSSALFIGIPTLLALGLAMTPKAKSVTGIILKGVTIALLVSGIFLGEGFVCVLMAAPLFYVVAGLIGWTIDRRRAQQKGQSLVIGIAFVGLLLSLEGTHDGLSFDRVETVQASRVLSLDAPGVKAKLAARPRFPKALTGFLGLGFPAPGETKGHGLKVGDTRSVHFAGGEGEGDLVMVVEEVSEGRVVFACQSDTTPIAHWLLWQRAVVTWAPAGQGKSRVTWTMHYRRSLDPAFYFKPLERYGVGCMAEYLLDSLEDFEGASDGR